MHIYRSKSEPNRNNPTWEERWGQADKGLVICWERGREKAEEEPELTMRARAGELLPLPWKGGLKPALEPKKETRRKVGKNYGTLFYLAMWQGLRGDDLDIYTDKDFQLICTKNNLAVTFTDDKKKLKILLK
jgi:hypothetical protein